MSRQPYTYTILRYRHDPVAGEQVNVGVVLYAPKSNFLGAHFRKAYGRISKIFPDVNGSALRHDLARIERAFISISKRDDAGLFAESYNVMNFANRVVGIDDSSLVWSDIGSGITNDPEKTLDDLHARFISQYDKVDEHRRQDAEIWKPFRDRLLERKINDIFDKKTIRTPSVEVEFEHAWKNGIWHCIQPLSFDLATTEGIQDKASRWVGQIVGLSKAEEEFKPYFLVGQPSDRDMWPAYDRAVNFLKEATNAQVIVETEIDSFANEIEDKVSHSRL